MSGQQSQGNKGGAGMQQPRFGSPPGAQFGMNPMMPFGQGSQGGYGSTQGGYGGQSNRNFPSSSPVGSMGAGMQPSGAGVPGASFDNFSQPGVTDTYQQMQEMYRNGNFGGSGYQGGPMGYQQPMPKPGAGPMGNFDPNGNPQVANFGNGLSLQEWQNMPASTRQFIPQPGSQDAQRMDNGYAQWIARHGTPAWTR